MQINILELWDSMGFPVRCVVIVLTLQAIACVSVAIDRSIMLWKSAKKAKTFAAFVQPSFDADRYDEVLHSLESGPGGHLSEYWADGMRTFLDSFRSGDTAEKAAEFARRLLERKGDSISRELNRGMNVLASTGSTAPFVGLLGTVLGIINAFKLIAQNGSGGIGTIGAAIGESLIVTGYGLVVAIPSVLVFNALSARIAAYEGGLVNAGGALIDKLEAKGQQSEREIAQAQQEPDTQPFEAHRSTAAM